jgi:hypothetical protein
MIKHWAYANYLDQDDQHTAALNQRAFFERKITQMALDLTDREHDDPVYIKRSLKCKHQFLNNKIMTVDFMTHLLLQK